MKLYDWQIHSLCRFSILLVLGLVVTRLVVTYLKHASRPAQHKATGFWDYLTDRHEDSEQRDFFAPVILGAMELAAFPIFLRAGLLEPIGAWIALKTLPQWKAWTDNRQRFNRFLVGQGLIVVFSYILSLQVVFRSTP